MIGADERVTIYPKDDTARRVIDNCCWRVEKKTAGFAGGAADVAEYSVVMPFDEGISLLLGDIVGRGETEHAGGRSEIRAALGEDGFVIRRIVASGGGRLGAHIEVMG